MPDGTRPETFVRPPPASPGDDVAIIAPSSGLASLFPEILDLAIERLERTFEVHPVVYPTAEADPEYLADHPEDRARDIHDAFRDPDVSAVFATIGGADQIKVLTHLDPVLLQENPTRFFGSSDNACLASYLWGCGVVSYYGGTLLSDVATPGFLPAYTERYLRRALFADALGPIHAAEEWTDDPVDWADDDYAETTPEFEPNTGRRWEAPHTETVEGRLWGGCLTIVHGLLAGDRAVPNPDAVEGDVLAIETSEKQPDPDEIKLMLTSIGERGLLQRFDAVLVGRPQTRSHEHDPGEAGRRAYREQQWEAMRDGIREYNSDSILVGDLDFGHTNPTVPLPIGDLVRVDPAAKEIVCPESPR